MTGENIKLPDVTTMPLGLAYHQFVTECQKRTGIIFSGYGKEIMQSHFSTYRNYERRLTRLSEGK